MNGADIRLIAAIGRRGQIGLNGALPWHAPDDLRRFRQKTIGGIVLMGTATFRGFPLRQPDPRNRVFASLGRGGLTTIDEDRLIHRDGPDWMQQPAKVARELLTYFPGRTLWVAGGARIYSAFMPLCIGFDISIIDYDGPADTWLPQLPITATSKGYAHV